LFIHLCRGILLIYIRYCHRTKLITISTTNTSTKAVAEDEEVHLHHQEEEELEGDISNRY
jgi:hypothetical protein